MKLSKKAITALSFTLGACLFVSTAFADMAIGTGYDRFKGSIKNTAAQMEQGLDNYTIEMLMTLKDNEQILTQSTSHRKVDTQKLASEETTATQTLNGDSRSHYSYTDPTMSVWKNGMDDTYYVTEFPAGMDRWNGERFSNPFKEEGAQEIEKIIDALVGNLKDHVQVDERSDGSRHFSGSLSEVQVPALVNAVASFAVKQMLNEQRRMDRETSFPEIDSDIFVKKVTGSASETRAGVLESVTGTVILSGKDKNGAPHEITLNVVFKLSDMGNTKVSPPDLSGAKVEKNVSEMHGFSTKHVGTYKNNILIEKDGELVKIGERILEITSVDSNGITGKYTEVVTPGFENEHPNPFNFTFEYDPSYTKSRSLFTYTNPNGEQENGQIHLSDRGRIYMDLGIEIIDEHSYRSNGRDNYDGQFSRVFE